MLTISMFFYKLAMGESVFNLNMVSTSFWILGFFIFLPSLIILLELPILIDQSNPTTSYIYGDFNNKLKAWLMQYWLMIGIPIGALIGRLIISQKVKINIKPIDFKNKKWPVSLRISQNTLFYSCLLYLILYSSILFLSLGSNNPLSVLLSGGDYIDMMISRNSFTGIKNPILSVFYNQDVLLIFSLISFALLLKTNQNKWKFLFFIKFCVVCFFSIIIGSSGSLIFYFFSLFALKYFITGKFINKFYLIAIFCSIFLMFLFFKTSEESTNLFIIKTILTRIFFDQTKGFYYALQIFPEINSFLGFSSSAVWLNELLLGTSSLDYGHILMENYNLRGVLSGTSGHFTSIFITEMWSNFGYIGILICPVWAGIVIYSIHYIFLKSKQTILNKVFYTYVTLFGFGYFSDFVRFYYPVNILFILFGTLIQLYLISFFVYLIPKKKNEIKN